MTDALTIALAQLSQRMGDLSANADAMLVARKQATGADLILFPELQLIGYPPEDLVLKPALAERADAELARLAAATADGGPAMLVGTIRQIDGQLYNAMALLDGGKIVAERLKHELPNYGTFDEKRVFAPGPLPGIIEWRGVKLGLPICEGWGMSEICGVGTVNPPGAIRIGTVGPAFPGVELKLAEDGEVLVRGPGIMLGYRNKPEQTAETIGEDGWLRTGDIGAFDEAGYLKIVDRKKEIIINAAGKNMSPANIEAHLKSAHPLIGQACCIGDARPYNTALIVLDADFAPLWAQQHGIEDTSLEALATNEAVIAEVQQGVDIANTHLARVEQIKKFTILEGDWAPGGDELTPTMKLKRKPIGAKYEAVVEAMYAG